MYRERERLRNFRLAVALNHVRRLLYFHIRLTFRYTFTLPTIFPKNMFEHLSPVVHVFVSCAHIVASRTILLPKHANISMQFVQFLFSDRKGNGGERTA